VQLTLTKIETLIDEAELETDGAPNDKQSTIPALAFGIRNKDAEIKIKVNKLERIDFLIHRD
jgi:hypothetical protein